MGKKYQIVYDFRVIPIGGAIFLFVLSIIIMLSAIFWLKKTKNFYEEALLTQGHTIEVSWPRKGFKLWFRDKKDAEKIMQAILPNSGEMARELSVEKLSVILASIINQLDSGEFEKMEKDKYFGCVKVDNCQKIYYHFYPDEEGWEKVVKNLIFLRRFLADQLFINSPYQFFEGKKELIML